MKIFIAYQHSGCEYEEEYPDYRFVKSMAKKLQSNGFNVIWDSKVPLGMDYEECLSDEIANVDVVIAVFDRRIRSNNANNDSSINKEISVAYARQLASKNGRPIIIPIVFGDRSEVPDFIRNKQGIYLNDPYIYEQKDSPLFYDVMDRLLFQLNYYKEKIKIDEEGNIIAQERIEKSINKHLSGVLKRLKKNEKRQRIYACILYSISGGVLLFTIVIAILLLVKIDFTNINIKEFSLVGLLCLFIVYLSISLSKFLFILAKSFMVESIRCSDRIHAISFGKFYIDAFDEKVSRDEIINIFTTWNIDNGATTFRNQSVEDYDPKINDLIGIIKKK